MSTKATLIVPSFGGGPNLERTIESCRSVCDETVIISTAIFESDLAHFKKVANQVIELPWNFTFLHGHGALHNQASNSAKNDWLLLLGVAETFAEEYGMFGETLRNAGRDLVFRCDHVNDHHTWKRVWNRAGGPLWSGIMHEEITRGQDGGKLFRMQDTEKVPDPDPLRTEVRKYIKTTSYNWLYLQLLEKPERLGAADAGWLEFVRGARENIEKFCQDHADLLTAAIAGEKDAFIACVERRLNEGKAAAGVNFNPQGETPSEGVQMGIGSYEHLIEKQPIQ